MKICRFRPRGGPDASAGGARLGLVEKDEVLDISAALSGLPAQRWPVPPGDLMVANLDLLRPSFLRAAESAERFALREVALLNPVPNASKIVCGVGNYPEHVAATGRQPTEHGLFFKAPSSAVGASEGVELRRPDRVTVHETELAIVIGRSGTNISAEAAHDYVAGYTIGLDMTMRGQEAYSYLKSFDTYAVIGPWLVTKDEIPDPDSLDITMHVDGELRQAENTGRMILGTSQLIEFASSIMTLHPGDILMTGNPKGASQIHPHDRMIAEISMIGRMEVAIRSATPRL